MYKVDSDSLESVNNQLEICVRNLERVLEYISELVFNFDSDEINEELASKRASLDIKVQNAINWVKAEKNAIKGIVDAAKTAESNNSAVVNGIMGSAGVGLGGSSVSGSYRSTGISTSTGPSGLQNSNGMQSNATNTEGLDKDQDTTLEGNETPTDTPTDVEIPDEDQDIGLEGKVPDTQVEAVIALIYTEDPNLNDEEKERIVQAIANINETEILEGLDEDIANRIRAEIIKDYLDGELELTDITKEQLQEYIESHPNIQIGFEIQEAISNFESLIEGGIVTEEEIKAILENHIEIHDEEDFIEAYTQAGGEEANISEIDSFYDPETDKIHIRDTADSTVITNSIMTILGEEITTPGGSEEIPGGNATEDVEIGESDTTIEMPGEQINNQENMTDVELDQDPGIVDVEIEAEEITSGDQTQVEIDGESTTTENTQEAEGTVTEDQT